MDLFVMQSPNPNMISVHLVKNGKEISVLFKKNSEGEFFVWEQQEFETPQINGHFAEVNEKFFENN